MIAGINRRYHPIWEASRLQADVAARCAGNKGGLKLEFPWEIDEELKRPPTSQELQKLKKQGQRFADMLNKREQEKTKQ